MPQNISHMYTTWTRRFELLDISFSLLGKLFIRCLVYVLKFIYTSYLLLCWSQFLQEYVQNYAIWYRDLYVSFSFLLQKNTFYLSLFYRWFAVAVLSQISLIINLFMLHFRFKYFEKTASWTRSEINWHYTLWSIYHTFGIHCNLSFNDSRRQLVIFSPAPVASKEIHITLFYLVNAQQQHHIVIFRLSQWTGVPLVLNASWDVRSSRPQVEHVYRIHV